MISIRAIWERHQGPQTAGLDDPVAELARLTQTAVSRLNASLDAAANIHPSLAVEPVRPISESANIDMLAGCELARAGYFKQAYALWRSWLEQSLFALYFLEAPLHRLSWKAVQEVALGEGPSTKLMLHQILALGEKGHHFALVYRERCEAVLRAWRVGAPKGMDPIRVANKRLTDLSQGVHGTYRPQPVEREDQLPGELKRHILPILSSTVRLVGFLWFVHVHSFLDLTDAQIASMRRPGFQPGQGDPEAILLPLVPQINDWLDELRLAQREGT